MHQHVCLINKTIKQKTQTFFWKKEKKNTIFLVRIFYNNWIWCSRIFYNQQQHLRHRPISCCCNNNTIRKEIVKNTEWMWVYRVHKCFNNFFFVFLLFIILKKNWDKTCKLTTTRTVLSDHFYVWHLLHYVSYFLLLFVLLLIFIFLD